MRRSSSRGSTSSCDAADAVDAQLDGRDAAVQRRPVVLDAGRHLDGLALDVHRDLEQVLGGASTRPSSGRARRRRRWSAPTIRRCPRRPATRRAWSASRSRAGSGGRAARAAAGRSPPDSSDQCCALACRSVSTEMSSIAPVGARLDPGVRAEADGGVERRRAVVEQIERPDVDGAAGQIDAGRSRSRRVHAHEL